MKPGSKKFFVIFGLLAIASPFFFSAQKGLAAEAVLEIEVVEPISGNPIYPASAELMFVAYIGKGVTSGIYNLPKKVEFFVGSASIKIWESTKYIGDQKEYYRINWTPPDNTEVAQFTFRVVATDASDNTISDYRPFRVRGTGDSGDEDGGGSGEGTTGSSFTTANVESSCSGIDKIFDFSCFASAIMNVLMWLFSWLVSLATFAFEYALKVSVFKFGDLLATPGVAQAWAAARDLANVFFIFILLYIGIGTILRLSQINAKKMVPMLLVVAILINFSAAITSVVIDASNIVAIHFYNLSKGEGEGASVRNNLMQNLKIQPITAGKFAGSEANLENVVASDKEVRVSPPSGSNNISDLNIIVGGFLAIVVMLITTFVFFAAAILLVVRAVVLTFIVILSPLAFLFAVFPKQEGLFGKWLHELFNQSFFAPVYMILIFIALTTAQGLGEVISQETLAQAFMSFAVVIGFMLFALIVAKQMGAKGAGMAMKLAGGATALTVGAAWGLTKLGGSQFGKRTGLDKKLEEGKKWIKGTPVGRAWESDWMKRNVRKSAAGQQVGEFLKSPLGKTSDMVATASGLGVGFMGDTAAARREAAKKQGEIDKEKKEAEKQAHLATLKNSKDPAEIAAAANKLSNADMKDVNIEELIKNDTLDHFVQNLSPQKLNKLVNDNELTQEQGRRISASITTIPDLDPDLQKKADKISGKTEKAEGETIELNEEAKKKIAQNNLKKYAQTSSSVNILLGTKKEAPPDAELKGAIDKLAETVGQLAQAQGRGGGRPTQARGPEAPRGGGGRTVGFGGGQAQQLPPTPQAVPHFEAKSFIVPGAPEAVGGAQPQPQTSTLGNIDINEVPSAPGEEEATPPARKIGLTSERAKTEKPGQFIKEKSEEGPARLGPTPSVKPPTSPPPPPQKERPKPPEGPAPLGPSPSIKPTL